MPARPSVLQLCLTLDTGGLERVVVNLANELALRSQFNSQICTVGRTTGELIPAEISPDVAWTELKGPPHASLPTALKLARLVRRHRIKLIHAHGTQPLVYALFASGLFRTPVIFTKHNSYEDLSFFIKRPMFNRLACARVRKFVGVSEQATEILKRVFVRAADRCATQINGTELPAEELRRAAAAARQNRDSRKPFVIATICRLAPEKDLVTLIRAFGSVNAVERNTELWIVGDGPERDSLLALAHQLNLKDRVRFWGFRGRVQQILSCSDLFVNSSLTEGVSISILEAMSMGLPVVATAVGGTPSIVRHDENGILVAPRDSLRLASAMLLLVQNASMRVRMGQQSWVEVEKKWSLERMAARYHEMYVPALKLKKPAENPAFNAGIPLEKLSARESGVICARRPTS